MARPTRAGRAFWRPVLLLAAVLTALTSVWLPSASASVVHYVYRTCTTPGGCGMWLRTAPSTGASHIGLMYDGTAFAVNCWQLGESVYGDPVWLQGVWNGQTGWAMDYYVDTHWSTTQDLTNQGMPQCGTTPPPPPSGNAPPVWVGAPFSGTWVPVDYDCPPYVSEATAIAQQSCSRPAYHHFLASASAPYGDFAVDLGAPVGTPAVVYAAPQNPAVAIRAVVDNIQPACSSRLVSDGGYAITVAFYAGSTRVGSATYGHINPMAGLTRGQAISRWGGIVGTVGTYNRGGCWTGPHLHFQMYSQHNYACYNRGWQDRQHMNPSNFLGYIGGNFASASRRPCP